MNTKGEHTKEMIRQVAQKLFAQKGFSAVTMADICEACGLSRGGLYRHYGSTRQVFEEILSSFSDDEDLIRQGIEQGKPALQILNMVLERMGSEMLDGERSLSFAVYEYACCCDRRFLSEINQKAHRKWTDFLNYGVARGEFAPVRAEQMADVILYLYQGVRMWSRVVPLDEKTVKNMLDKIRSDLEKEKS